MMDSILASTDISDEDRNKFDSVLERLAAYFKGYRWEGGRFNQRSQLEGESAELYITVLHNLIKFC